MKKKKVLLIEDNADIVEALEIILENSGYDYRSVMDSKKIFKEAVAFLPDLIILDALLSGADGPHVAAELKRIPETKAVPIIMVSAHPAIEKMAKEAHVDGYLPKPFDIETLLQKIEAHIT